MSWSSRKTKLPCPCVADSLTGPWESTRKESLGHSKGPFESGRGGGQALSGNAAADVIVTWRQTVKVPAWDFEGEAVWARTCPTQSLRDVASKAPDTSQPQGRCQGPSPEMRRLSLLVVPELAHSLRMSQFPAPRGRALVTRVAPQRMRPFLAIKLFWVLS